MQNEICFFLFIGSHQLFLLSAVYSLWSTYVALLFINFLLLYERYWELRHKQRVYYSEIKRFLHSSVKGFPISSILEFSFIFMKHLNVCLSTLEMACDIIWCTRFPNSLYYKTLMSALSFFIVKFWVETKGNYRAWVFGSVCDISSNLLNSGINHRHTFKWQTDHVL